MSGVTTGETSLPTAAGSDILRDFMKGPLVTAEQTIADKFDSGIGHTHNGAGEGPPITRAASPSISGPVTLTSTAAGQNIQANDGIVRVIVQDRITIAGSGGFGQIVTNTGELAGLAFIVAGDGHSAVVALMGGAHTVALLAGTSNFTATFSTAGKYNVGWNTAQYMIENQTGAPQTFDVVAMG
jgi:hypothetical protein